LAASNADLDIAPSLIAFVAFSMMAMAVYAVNDTLDAFYDMHDPQKCTRPIASGRVSETAGLRLAGLLAFGSLTLAGSALGFEPTLWLITYFVLSIFYSHIAKDVAVIDVLIVASGFAIRLAVGLSVTGLQDELGWLLVPVFVAACCLAIGKRLVRLTGVPNDVRKRLSPFYTKKRTTWLLILLSNLAVVMLATLVSFRWGDLVDLMGLSAFNLAFLAAIGLIAWTQIIYAMLIKSSEPADIFTQDRVIVFALGAGLSAVIIERIL
jgi:4-hydroxybenzoate polyprenyltransferase